MSTDSFGDQLQATLGTTYVIERALGAGGMATVYLAEDLRHHRKVAIKVLHPELSAVLGPERFLAEIRTTANLQHPHILPLFDSGEAGGLLYYVMPYVEGETLRARLERERQLPVLDAVRIASEVASALDYAHRHGVVHRDIKPENILLHDGAAVVADFGIALAVEQAGGARMTQTGLSLGTPQYMSPEQAMGERHIDARTDIYSLGAVTYEMLVGEPPFTGPNAQAIVAKVLTEGARSVAAHRRAVPPNVDAAVAHALEKLPADRFATAREFASALEPTAHAGLRATSVYERRAPTRWPRSATRIAPAIAVALVAFVAGWILRTSTSAHTGVPPERRAVQPLSPTFTALDADIVMSADGRTLAVTDAGGIFARRLDRVDLFPVPGAAPNEGGGTGLPFLSADGSRIGFMNGRDLVVQRLDGSALITIAGASLAGGAFLDGDRVAAVDTLGLSTIRLSDGTRDVIARAPRGTRLLQPTVLPDAHRVLVSAAPGDLAGSRILSIDLASRHVDTLPLGPALRPQYADGWLFFARPTGALYAVPFDADNARVRGEPVATGEQSSVSRTGAVAFAAGPGVIAVAGRPKTRLVALAPGGHREVLLETPGAYHNPRVSPDGRQLLFDVNLGNGGGRDVWALDLATHALSRLTSVGDAHDAVWTPDGRHITYLSFSTRGGPIVTAAADGTPGVRLIAASGEVNPGQWLPDGSAYIAGIVAGQNNGDLFAFSRDGNGRTPLATSRFDEHSPAISPDGRLMAYVSDETGRREVYVRSLHGTGRVLVSEASGEEPVWSRDGRQLLYVEHHGDSTRVIAAHLVEGTPPRVAAHTVVLDHLRYEPVSNHANWDVMPDGRMVFVEPLPGTQLELIFDWRPPSGTGP